ncbi:hypothetical protein B0H14DRAFT_2577645 [Mycena olivaceomarginata]|nr:hypothetical protein B0H14DRAFT_2577645 [Mycena olivaceomarginata]
MDVLESGKGLKGEREEECIGIIERAGPGGQDLSGMSPQHRETAPQACANECGGSRVVADRTKTWYGEKIDNLMCLTANSCTYQKKRPNCYFAPFSLHHNAVPTDGLGLHAVPVTGTAVVLTGPEREQSVMRRPSFRLFKVTKHASQKAYTAYSTVYGMFSGPVDPSTAVFDGNGRQKCSERAHGTGRTGATGTACSPKMAKPGTTKMCCNAR